MPRFVDTNVLLYAISSDPAEVHKRDRARSILAERDLVLSTQVLGEFYMQATRPSRGDRLSHALAVEMIRSLRRYQVQPVDYSIVEAGLVTKERYQLSYWDALIIEAAREAGCRSVLSEDLQSGQDFAGVVVSNPFVDVGADE